MIKRLASLMILSVLLLTSCLRRADVPPPAATESYSVSESETEGTTETADEESSSMEEYPIHEPEISDTAQAWIDLRPDPDGIIMTFREIMAENDRVSDTSDVMTDVSLLPETVTADDIRSYMRRGHVPHLPRYDSDGSEIPNEHLQNVIASMGDSSVPEKVEPIRAIVTTRANLRSIPDSKPYRKAPTDPYDTIQQTELHVGDPVWVLHENTDGEYLFVISASYVGWVRTDYVAVTDSAENFEQFASPERFVCITVPSVKLEDNELDMGVVLPFISEDIEGFTVKLPRRLEDGTLSYTELRLTRDVAHKGYLDFTYENFIIQAFRYEGVMYSWGGLDTGVDCSSFVGNVLRTFGFRLPRDTKDQQGVVGDSTEVRGKSHAEIARILESTDSPTAVYYPGHVLFYLGRSTTDGKFYFIHAPQIGEAVSVTSKVSLEGMTYICEFSAGKGGDSSDDSSEYA